MIVYRKVNGEATDLRITADDYILNSGELTIEGEVLPDISTLHDATFNSQSAIVENRKNGYGTIAEQLDMMYWDSVNGTTSWKDHVAQVKLNNPK